MRIRLLVLFSTFVTVLSVAPAANAVTGDRTFYNTKVAAELATNQCRSAWVQTVNEGGPYPATTNTEVYFAGSYSGCYTRARILFVKNGVLTRTGYSYTGTSGGYIAAVGVHRCYTEFGVRRTDGTYYTRFQINNNHNGGMPPGCHN